MKNFLNYFRIGFFTGLLSVVYGSTSATHLMGGELTYTYNSSTSSGSYYDVKLIVYRYCDTTLGVPAPLDSSMMLGAFRKQYQWAPNMIYWNSTWNMPLISSSIVGAPPGNSSCMFQPTVCVEKGEYLVTIFLPVYQEGYHLLVERCCRNSTIVNLANPGAVGMTFYTYVPSGIVNSSPQIADVSVPFICSNDTTTIINNAFDPDGDSLSYSFVAPYAGTSGSGNNSPDPFTSSPYTLPVIPVIYDAGYSVANPFGASGYASIYPQNGMTRYYIPNQGLYVVAIEIKEYRNGVLIGAIRRDLQYVTIVCPPNSSPLITSTIPGGVYTVAENQQLCFNVTSTDITGDSLFLFADGPLLDAGSVNPPGVMADAVGAGTVSSTFCWTPVCGMSRLTPYEFFVIVVDDGCPPKSSSQLFSVYVTGGAPSINLDVAIHSNQPSLICEGAPVILNATCNFPGISPVYSWFVNGVQDTSVSDSIFSSTNLINGDVVTVTVISNATCLFTNSATSPPYVININIQPAVQVSISSFPLHLCPYQNCLFTATVSNGGASPSYQWYLNGTPTGANLHLFSASTFAGPLNVYVVVTPSTGCPVDISDTIDYLVGPMLFPFVTISGSVFDSLCPGHDVLFVAHAHDIGAPPIFDWMLNGISMGVVSNDSLVLSNINDGDSISVSATSVYSCLDESPVYSRKLGFHYFPMLEVNLTDGPIELCTGKTVSLEAITTGGHSSTIEYYWSAGTSTGNVNSFIPEVSGYYYLIADDHCTTPVSDSIYIELLPAPVSDFYWAPELPSEFQPEVTFTDMSIDALQWQWDFGDQATSTVQNPIHAYMSAGHYPVELVTTNILGCTDTLVKEIEIEKAITIYIPNSFTPNNDGKNDEFGVFASDGIDFTLSIYNRWGKEIFTSSSPLNKWSGMNSSGKKAPTGSYIYKVTASDGAFNKTFSGTVALIR